MNEQFTIVDEQERKRVEASEDFAGFQESLQGFKEGKVTEEQIMELAAYYISWKCAIIDGCDASWIPWEHTGALDQLSKLIESEVQMALDPAISSDARDLIRKGEEVYLAKEKERLRLAETIKPQQGFDTVTDFDL